MTLPPWLVESGRPAVNWWFRRVTGRCLSEVAPARAAASVRCPVFIAHGTADRTFPLRSAHHIFVAIPTQKVFNPVEGHDHFTTAQSGEPLWRNLFAFFDEYLVSPSVTMPTQLATPNPLVAAGPKNRQVGATVALPRFVDVPAADYEGCTTPRSDRVIVRTKPLMGFGPGRSPPLVGAAIDEQRTTIANENPRQGACPGFQSGVRGQRRTQSNSLRVTPRNAFRCHAHGHE